MGSIPLVALMGNQYQPESLLSAVGKANAIRSSQQQQQQSAALFPGQQQIQQQNIQSNQQQLQQGKIQLQDQQAVTDAMHDWDGKNMEELPGLVLKHGGSAQAVFGLRDKVISQKQNLLKLSTDEIANQAAQNDQLLGKLNTLDDVPDAKLPQEIAGISSDPQHQPILQQLAGIAASDPSTARDHLEIIKKSLMGAKEQFSQANQQKETEAKQLQAQADMLRAQQGNIGIKEMNDWLAKNPGKGPSDYEVAMKKIVPAFNLQMQANLLTPEAQKMAAQNYSQTGQLPAGMRSPGATSSILNAAAANPGGAPNVAANKATYGADAGSLKKLQSNFDQVTAFENTAGKNLDQFLNVAKNVVDSGSPLINQPLRAVADKVAGSPNQAAFDAARVTALTEIAKVLNSSNASGVLSDSARSEVSGLIGKDATLAQIYKAAQILKTDMGNRHDAYQQQISDIKGRLGARGQQQQSQSEDLGPAPPGAIEGHTGTFNGVKARIVNGRIVAQ